MTSGSRGMSGRAEEGARRFVKKPVEVEAMRFDGTNGRQLAEWSENHVGVISEMHAPLVAVVYTLEGAMRGDIGDWIVRGIQGEFYPVKPDIFEATYEPASTPARSEAER